MEIFWRDDDDANDDDDDDDDDGDDDYDDDDDDDNDNDENTIDYMVELSRACWPSHVHVCDGVSVPSNLRSVRLVQKPSDW